jgi:flavin reductase (DIM6/NTAB) family NADH-FMN oxidoreductase RutF
MKYIGNNLMEIQKFHESLDKILFFLKKVPTPGLLLVAGNGKDKNNIMTIGWMQIGVLWKEPAISIAVRPSRYTFNLLQEFDGFTINAMSEKYKDEIAFCGAKSGAFCDKFKETKLKVINSAKIQAYLLKDAEFSLECKIMHRTYVDPDKLNDIILARYYANQNFHEIITAAILNIK